MSDLSANEQSSFGSMRYYNHTVSRPKYQPIRVKELANFSDSDEEESEAKVQDSSAGSDSEDSEGKPECVDVADAVVNVEGLEQSVCENKGESEEGLNSEPVTLEPEDLMESHSNKFVNGKLDEHKAHSANYCQDNGSNMMQSHSYPQHSKVSTNHMMESNGSLLRTSNYNLQAADVKYEAPVQTHAVNQEQTHNENTFNSGKILTSEAGSLLNPIDPLITDTPLKHAGVNCARPHPCYSRRNIIETPQSKILPDLSKSNIRSGTPATALSNWSYNNSRKTPLQTRHHSGMERLQTPHTLPYFASSAGNHDTPFFSTEVKSVRRPLADATDLMQNEGSIDPLDAKPWISQGSLFSKMEEVASDPMSELGMQRSISKRSSTVKKILEVSEKPAQLETNSNEYLKENKPPNLIPTSESKSRPVQNLDVQSYPPKIHEKDNNPAVNSTEPESQHSVSNNKNEQENLNQIVDKISNVQFSIPTNPKPKHNKILTVKEKKYLVLGELGQGMSGEVFRVQDLANRELRAIKCVNLSRMDKDSAQGCLEEISMLHKLQASCVVKMFDYEIKYPMVYVVMEMGDIDLSRLLKSMSQDKHLPLTMILYYWTEMLTAVKYIHDNGVIHSDLKPANFLLVRGRLKLIDFGIASSMNADMTSVVKNCTIGTLNYISPEALMDIGGNADSPTHKVKYKINFKSDVWSLGCILYSLVYGHTPFHHIRSQWAKVNAITNPKPDISFPPTMASQDESNRPLITPPVLIDVMRKCLQHDPKARPTVAQLLEVPYIPTKPERTLPLSRDIPSNVLVKIRQALSGDEWRQLTQILESRR